MHKAYTLGEAENLTIGCQTRDSDTEFKILEEVVRKYDLVKLEELAH